MPASADTVLCLVRRMTLPEPEPPRVVAVDDWAKRRGRTYGTIVVDLERRRVIDLLPDRTSATVADWLRQRPGIEVIARDRSTEYARAAALGAPKAVQVAGRWHLLTNVRDMLERWLARAHARLRGLPLPPGATRRPGQRARAFGRAAPNLLRGLTAAPVGCGLRGRAAAPSGRGTLTPSPRYRPGAGDGAQICRRRELPRTGRASAGGSILDPFLPTWRGAWREGCEDAMALWREMKARATGTAPRWCSARWLRTGRGRLANGAKMAARAPEDGQHHTRRRV